MNKYMSMGQMVQWIKNNKEFVVSRRTLYNWAIRGRMLQKIWASPDRIYLQTTILAGKLVTTVEWMEEFLVAIQ